MDVSPFSFGLAENLNFFVQFVMVSGKNSALNNDPDNSGKGITKGKQQDNNQQKEGNQPARIYFLFFMCFH